MENNVNATAVYNDRSEILGNVQEIERVIGRVHRYIASKCRYCVERCQRVKTYYENEDLVEKVIEALDSPRMGRLALNAIYAVGGMLLLLAVRSAL